MILISSTDGKGVLHLGTGDTISKFKIAAVLPLEDENCGYYTELVQSNRGLPYNATFYECTGQANAVNLGNLESGKYIILWILRELDEAAIEANETCDQLYENFQNGITLPTVELPEFHLEWQTP